MKKRSDCTVGNSHNQADQFWSILTIEQLTGSSQRFLGSQALKITVPEALGPFQGPFDRPDHPQIALSWRL